ncbi:MAG TPA: phosphotransferase [Thermomicrobiales bacterium]|nr:phosphotransferase [Thermomicrobiales bacterium]
MLPAPLEPEITAFLEQRHGAGALTGLERQEMTSVDSATGASLERLVLPGTLEGAVRYVVKRLQPRGDWIGRATNDERMREYRLATGGIYKALPAGIGTAVAGSVELPGGAALIMHDVAPALIPPGDDPISDEQLTRSLQALARLHSTFYGFPARLLAGLGLCTPMHWLTLLAPSTAEREAATIPPDPVTPHILPGWEAFARLVPDAWVVVRPLLADPMPLVRGLRECPDTFLHGDAKCGNLGFSGEQVILLDWSLALRAPGALDLGWYLAVNSARLPIPRETAIEIYRVARAEHGRLPVTGEQWERELALSLLAGTLRLGWAKALGASSDDPVTAARENAELAYWSDVALGSQRWLG